MKTLEDIIKKAQAQDKMTLAVAAAHEPEVLKAVVDAKEHGIISPILIGDKNKIENIAISKEINLDECTIINTPDLEESAMEAVKKVSCGEADFIMKGLVDTPTLLRAVLNKEEGLRTGNLLSHVMVYEIPNYHKLLFLTDGGMNIAPTLEEKKGILGNAIVAARAILDSDHIKISCLAANEKVSKKMQATVDGDKLKYLAQQGYFGDDIIVEGPIAFDLAISKNAAKIKGFKSPVAGESDIILVPTIEVGNGIGKALSYFANGKSAGIIMGAKVPVVLVSRADDAVTKLNSIALGSAIAATL